MRYLPSRANIARNRIAVKPPLLPATVTDIIRTEIKQHTKENDMNTTPNTWFENHTILYTHAKTVIESAKRERLSSPEFYGAMRAHNVALHYLRTMAPNA
jgi:hypothetical protein